MPSIIHGPARRGSSVRRRASGRSAGRSSTIVCCQNVPPTDGRDAVPARDADAEQAELGVGAAGDDRRARGAARCSAAAARDLADHGARLDARAATTPRSRPIRSRMVSDQSRSARSNMPELDPQEGVGRVLAGEPVREPVAEHPHVARRPQRRSGRCRAIQRNRAGAVIATQSPAARVDLLRGARLGRARRPRPRPGQSTFGQAQISRPPRRRAPCPRACSSRATAAIADRVDRRPLERLVGRTRGELPVRRRVEDLRAGDAGRLGVGVLALADRDLSAVGVEQHGPAAPGARVDGRAGRFAHRQDAPASARRRSRAARRPAKRSTSAATICARRGAASRRWPRRCAG